MNQEPLVARRTSLFARRGAMVAVCLALVIDLAGLAMGLSEGGYGWAFKMPLIAPSGLAALTASVAALILGIMRLMQRRGRDVATWFVLAGALVTGLGGLLLVLISLAASASI